MNAGLGRRRAKAPCSGLECLSERSKRCATQNHDPFKSMPARATATASHQASSGWADFDGRQSYRVGLRNARTACSMSLS
jgi:hypothetical protein